MKIRFTAIVLIFILFLEAIPAFAMGNDVCDIASAEDFIAFIERVNAGEKALDARLTDDINLTPFCSKDDPLTVIKSYNGMFDGRGHVIAGVVIEGTDNWTGLFCENNGTVMNITVFALITGRNSAAAVGENNGIIKDITVYADIYSYGGCAAVAAKNNGTISLCQSFGTLYAYDDVAGGICAANNGIIESSVNNAAIVGDELRDTGVIAERIGGIAGVSHGTLSYSVNYGNVYGKADVGGIAGAADSVLKCENYADVYGHKYRVGGIAGYGVNITDCANSGSVVAVSDFAGGIVGYLSGVVSNSENSGTISSRGERCGGIEGLAVGALVKGSSDRGKTEKIKSGSRELLREEYITKGGHTYSAYIRMDEEKGIYSDMYALFVGSFLYFFLPHTSDVKEAAIVVAKDFGEVVSVYDGVDLESENTVVEVGGNAFTVKTLKSDMPSVTFTVDESFGPISAMNSSKDHSVKCYGDVRIDVPKEIAEKNGWEETFNSAGYDNSSDPGTMSIKGRGNSTWMLDGMEKRPYQFKLEKKQDILGMGKAKTWLLIKNDEDIIRNKLALDLGREMGIKYTSLGEFVDVFMNGRYLGNYLLTEKVEVGNTRVDISDLDDEFEENGSSIEGIDMTGGYLLEVDAYDPTERQVKFQGGYVSIKSPGDIKPDSGYDYIKDYVADIFGAIYEDGLMNDGTSYLDHIDKDSFAAYFWHQEFLKNADCGRGSTYFYKDKDSIDPLLYAGPIWDNDRIYEGAKTFKISEGWFMSTVVRAEDGAKTVYNVLFGRKEFLDIAAGYYEEHDLGSIFAGACEKIEEYQDYLTQSAKMNAVRWGYTELDIDKFSEVLSDRAVWIDENYKALKEAN